MGFEERLKAFSAASSGTAKKPESTEFQDRLQRFSDDSHSTQTTGTAPVKTAPVQKSPVLPTKYRTITGGFTYDTDPAVSPSANSAHTGGKFVTKEISDMQHELDRLRNERNEGSSVYGYGDTNAMMNQLARQKAYDEQIAALERDLQAHGVDTRTGTQRELDALKGLFSGTAKSYAGQQLTTLGSIGEAERQSGYAQGELAQAQEAAERFRAEMDATDDSDPAWWAAKTQYDQAAERVRVLQEQVEGYGRADRLLETGYELTQQGEAEKQFGRDSGALDIQIGNFDVDDALFNAASMGIEQGLDFVTGLVLPGKMTAFFSRAYGGAYQKARSEGATPQQASIYAGSVGAVEAFTEKLGNIPLPQKAVYGVGKFDDMIENAVMSFANRFSTAAGQNVAYYLGKLTAGGFGEFVEELIGNLAEWQLPRIYDGDVESGSEALAGAVEEGLTAAISAIFGGAADLNNYGYSGSDQQIQFIANEAIRKYGVTEKAVEERSAGYTADVAQEAPTNANVTLAALAREMTEESEERPETSAPRPTLATTATGTQQAGRDTAATETAQRAAETPASDAQTALRESAQRGGMGQHGIEAIGEFYRGGNVSTYYGDFARAYTAGREGREIGLGNMAEQGAWNAGRMDALEITRVEKSAPKAEETTRAVEGTAPEAASSPQTESAGAYRFEIVPGDGGYTLRVTDSESGEVTEIPGYATEEEAHADIREYQSVLASDSAAGYNGATTTKEGTEYGGGAESVRSGSTGIYAQRSGQQAGAVQAGAEGTGGQRGAAAQAGREGKGNLKTVSRRIVRAEEVIPGAEPGQKLVVLDGPENADQQEGYALAKKNGIQSVTPFEGGVLAREHGAIGEKRAFQYGGRIGAQVNNEEITFANLVRHEIAEYLISHGRMSVDAALDAADVDSRLLDAAVDFYYDCLRPKDRQLSSEEAAAIREDARRELVCDAGDHINQLRYDVEHGALTGEYYRNIADLLDTVLDAVHAAESDLTDGAFELSGQTEESVGAEADGSAEYTDKEGNKPYSRDQAVRFSSKITRRQDADYLAAVERGDMDEAQRMVDEAAKAAGYDSPMLYHGTLSFGFTEFDPAKSDDGISLFATSDPKIAQTYSNRNEIRRVNVPQKLDTPEQILAVLKERPMLWDAQYFPADATDRKTDFVDMILDRLIMQLNERAYFDVADEKAAEIWKAAGVFKKSIGTEKVKQTARDLYDAILNADLYWHTDIVSDTSQELTYAIDMLRGNFDAYWYLGNYHNTETAIKTIKKNGADSGNYALYGRTDGMLEIDGRGENWNRVPVSGDISKALSGERTATTREIARYGKDNGYTGVLIHNITDNGGFGIGTGAGDVYIYFDGISLKSADPVTYDDNGNIIPLSERFNAEDQDIRFSGKLPVEVKDRFIALHNMSPEAVRGALELGGMAMPSVAMVPSTAGHDTYGEISAVFRKESVSPTDRRNRIFSGDAYTPTFPEVGIKISEKAADKAEKKVKALLKNAGVEGEFSLALDTDNLRDQIQRFGSLEKAYGNKTEYKLAFLQDTGRGVTIPRMEKVYTNRADIATLRKLAKEIDLDAPYGDEGVMKYEPIVRRLVREYAISKYGQQIADKLRPADKALSFSDVDNVIHAARELQYSGQTRQVDKAKLEKRVDIAMRTKKIQAEYSAWMQELGKDMVEKRGIRNNRDFFDRYGNRRSFEQLYYDYTLANIVKAMESERQQGKSTFLTGSGNIRGASAKSYESIEDARKDIGRIRNMALDEAAAPEIQEFDRKTLDLCNRMVEGRGHNKYTGPWDAAEVLTETLSQYKTADQIYRYWKREYGDGGYYNLTREIAEEAAALVKEAQQLPTSYLEAKLYRAVPLEEPLAWVVPNNEKELIQEMRDAGLNVVTYKHGDSADRLKKVNSIPGAQFSSKLTTENELRRQNERLQEQLAAAKKQTEYTVHPEPRKTDVEAVARGIVKRYGSSIKGSDISGAVGDLATDIFSGDTTFVGVKEKAAQIAREIVDNAEELKSPDMESYQQIRAQLRQPIIISERDAHDVSPEWGAWRNAHRGRVNVSINGNGTPVDVMYAQLSEAYPGYFPDSITHPADQVIQMVNVMDTLAPVMENPFSYYMAEAIEYCANDLIVSIVNDVDSAAPTFADRANQKLIEAKAHGKVALENLRAEKNAKIEDLKQRNAWATAQKLAQVRAQRDKQIQAIKEAYAESRKAASERRADSAARSRLLRIARRLQNQKLPAVTRALLQQYIGELDTVSKSITDKSIEKLSELRDWYMDQKENNPDFISDPGIEKRLQRLSKTQIKDLTSTQVAELTEVLLNIENEIRTQRQLIDSEDKRDTYAQGAQVIEDLKQVKGSDPRGIAGIIDRYILDESLSPVRFMRRLVGWNESDPLLKLTNALADGQRKMFDFQMRAKNLFMKWTENKALTKRIAGKHAQEIAISGMSANGPVTVKITPAMRMSLYLHSLNDQNLKHIAGGGITIPDMKLYKAGKIADAYARGTTIRLTPSEVRQIASHMTAEERAFARAAHAYFNGMSQQEINAVSEKLKGYSLAMVEDYFPINTDTSFTNKDFDAVKFDGTIEGMGSLKERVNAAGPIMLRDMNAVLNQSIDSTAKYVGLAIPVRNFNKVWGVTKRSFNADGSRNGADSSVQQAVRKTWGESGYNYIEKMMTDLQSGGRKVEQWDKVFNRIRSNYAGAVLTLNLSVAMKQMASYPTAGAVVGFGPLARAMADIGKVDLSLIAKYTPLQWYRSQGFSTQELGDLSNRGIKLPPALNWVQGADLLTTRKLWKAAEYYVRANNKGLEGDAYYKAVAEVYNRIIEETQPNYTTLQRPQLLRSDSTLLQNLAMFKTQPFQNFNILYDAYGNLRAKRAAYMNAENKAEEKAAYQQAQKQARWATGSQIVQLAVFAGMTFAWNLLRGKLDKYKDDDDEATVKSVLGGILKDMLSGAAAQVPFGADAYEAINSIVTGEKYYGMDAVAPSALSDFFTEFVNASENIKDVVADLSNPDADVNWDKQRKKLDKFLKAGSKILGVPFENVENIFNMAYQRAAQAAAGKYVGQYAYLQLTTDLSTSNGKGKAYDLLYGAMQHNYSQYQELYRAMLDDGFEEKNIKTAMENRMKEAQGAKSVDDLDERWEAP